MSVRRLSVAILLLALAGAASAQDRSDQERDLEKAIASRDKDRVASALGAAMSAGDERAARFLLRALPSMRGLDVREPLLSAIAGMSEEAAVEQLAKAAGSNSNPEVRYVLVEGLARQGSDAARRAVIEAVGDDAPAVAAAAARGVRGMPSPEAIDALIARLEKAEAKPDQRTLARELQGALAALTGQPIPHAEIWKSWWAANKATWQPPAAPGGGGGGDENVVDRLKRNRPEDAETIAKLAGEDVIVVRGSSDKVGQVLKAIDVEHRQISAEDLASLTLDPRSVLVLNCNGNNDPYTDAEFAKIRDFVERGGYLFTSDWQLSHTLAKAFPGAIALDQKTQPDEFVAPIFAVATDHPLMRDVFPATTFDARPYTWQIDGNSELIKLQSNAVTVLVQAPELEKRWKAPAVAVTFRWQGGRPVPPAAAFRRPGTGSGRTTGPLPGAVLHVMSHFEKQRSADAGDHFALQQLLLNFILEKQCENRGG